LPSILACADSRVAPEILFDQGLGDLFVARVAGNVVDDAILASLEYSVIHLGSTLIMVLGHERCGAVKATIDALDGHGSEEDVGTKIGARAGLIAPAVGAVPKGASDRLDSAISLNAAMVAAKSSPAARRFARGSWPESSRSSRPAMILMTDGSPPHAARRQRRRGKRLSVGARGRLAQWRWP